MHQTRPDHQTVAGESGRSFDTMMSDQAPESPSLRDSGAALVRSAGRFILNHFPAFIGFDSSPFGRSFVFLFL
jgi:hypothetical protein